MTTLKYIRRGGELYGTKEADGWWLLWNVNPTKGYIGNFESRVAMFEWINEAEKVKQHQSLQTRVPKRLLKDTPVNSIHWLDKIEGTTHG